MDARAIGWARGVWDALRPYATGSVYFPGFGEAEESLDGATFGESGQRLAAIRAKSDPDGLFAEAAQRPSVRSGGGLRVHRPRARRRLFLGGSAGSIDPGRPRWHRSQAPSRSRARPNVPWRHPHHRSPRSFVAR
jgi:hypothetical protein